MYIVFFYSGSLWPTTIIWRLLREETSGEQLYLLTSGPLAFLASYSDVQKMPFCEQPFLFFLIPTSIMPLYLQLYFIYLQVGEVGRRTQWIPWQHLADSLGFISESWHVIFLLYFKRNKIRRNFFLHILRAICNFSLSGWHHCSSTWWQLSRGTPLPSLMSLIYANNIRYVILFKTHVPPLHWRFINNLLSSEYPVRFPGCRVCTRVHGEILQSHNPKPKSWPVW